MHVLPADEFVAQDKVYSGTLRLGEITPSYDAEMEVSETAPWQHISGGTQGGSSHCEAATVRQE